jgi:archaellum component FlaF (FlaF/FlaG flagellin family)
MKTVQEQTSQDESSTSSKRTQISNENNYSKMNLKKGTNLSLKIKLLIFTLIGIVICLTAAVIIVTIIHLKSVNQYKNEISDLETEKRVLEDQKERLNNTVNHLTNSNSNLNVKNLDLNNKLAKIANDDIVRNKTYVTLSDVAKEGVSLKTTFSSISKGIKEINSNTVARLEQSSERELEENVNSLKLQLELINSLMEQISINLDLANQNKELLANNINLSKQLNQQIVNNTVLLTENQNLIKEKLELNNKLDVQTDINKILKIK